MFFPGKFDNPFPFVIMKKEIGRVAAVMELCEWYIDGKSGEKLTVRKMRMDEAQLAMDLQHTVWRSMPDPAQLAETTLDEIRESMTEDICLGVFDGETLAAFSIMVVNRASETRNAGQKNAYPPEECVTFDTIFVHPDYRGLGLQRRLFAWQAELAVKLGAKRIFATVAPQNEYSLNNMLACGFEILDRKLLYGNRDRYIMMRQL